MQSHLYDRSYFLPTFPKCTPATLFDDVTKFLNNYPVMPEIYKLPLSKINEILLESILFALLSHSLAPQFNVEKHVKLRFKRLSLTANIKIDEKIYFISKILHSSADFRILLGKIWDYSQLPVKLIFFVYDPAGFFLKIPDSIPSNCHIILHPKPHQSRKIKVFDFQFDDAGSYSLFHANHPAKDRIDQYFSEFKAQYMKEYHNINSIPQISEITNILSTFPLVEFLQNEWFISPILESDLSLKEEHIEWINTLCLQCFYPQLTVNQYRTDDVIFDLILGGEIIIEFKYIKQSAEYQRLIGQIWEYSLYNKPLIAYIYDPNQKVKPDPNVFPSTCWLIVK